MRTRLTYFDCVVRTAVASIRVITNYFSVVSCRDAPFRRRQCGWPTQAKGRFEWATDQHEFSEPLAGDSRSLHSASQPLSGDGKLRSG